MNDHLPECPGERSMCNECGDDGCICEPLRACEQRVLLSKPNIELSAVYGYEAGRADGLDAARDAVAALPQAITVDKKDALAVIDALRDDDD